MHSNPESMDRTHRVGQGLGSTKVPGQCRRAIVHGHLHDPDELAVYGLVRVESD